jgi:LysR family glycine cleavage system transcriptional activator
MMAEQDMTTIDRIDVDLIVARKALHGADVECVPLLEDRTIAVCGPKTALKVGDMPYPKVLEKTPLLFLESEPEWGGLLSGASPKPTRVRRAATIQDERLLLDAVERELGIGYLPQVLAGESLATGRSVHLTQVPATARARLWLMRSRLTPRTSIVNRAFDWLLAQAATAHP